MLSAVEYFMSEKADTGFSEKKLCFRFCGIVGFVSEFSCNISLFEASDSVVKAVGLNIPRVIQAVVLINQFVLYLLQSQNCNRFQR